MKTKLKTAVVPGIIGLVSAAVLLVGCQASQKVTTTTADASPKSPAVKVEPLPKMEPRILVEGGKAFVRVSEYASEAQKGWKPAGTESKLAFGDVVSLVRKKEKDGPNNVFWLASKESGPQVWIPAYVLTSSQVEIDSLKAKGRIPETLTYFYESKGGNIMLAGKATLGPFVLTTDAAAASNQGSDQAAFKGNGVVFDSSAAKHKWAMPMIFSNGSTTWEIKSNLMCYCTGVDSKGSSGCAVGVTVSDCSAPTPTRAKGTFECVEVAGEPAAEAQQKAP